MINQRHSNPMLLALFSLLLFVIPTPGPTAAAPPAPPLVTQLADAVRLDWRGDSSALRALGAAARGPYACDADRCAGAGAGVHAERGYARGHGTSGYDPWRGAVDPGRGDAAGANRAISHERAWAEQPSRRRYGVEGARHPGRHS